MHYSTSLTFISTCFYYGNGYSLIRRNVCLTTLASSSSFHTEIRSSGYLSSNSMISMSPDTRPGWLKYKPSVSHIQHIYFKFSGMIPQQWAFLFIPVTHVLIPLAFFNTISDLLQWNQKNFRKKSWTRLIRTRITLCTSSQNVWRWSWRRMWSWADSTRSSWKRCSLHVAGRQILSQLRMILRIWF